MEEPRYPRLITLDDGRRYVLLSKPDYLGAPGWEVETEVLREDGEVSDGHDLSVVLIFLMKEAIASMSRGVVSVGGVNLYTDPFLPKNVMFGAVGQSSAKVYIK